tara:strand:+ start:97 stop:1026 length:930 start_codon:yes stop_codon:yes gene_type:complete
MGLKIIFMGTPVFAVPILSSISESKHQILEVFTQPPAKKGRGHKISLSPIHEFADQLKIKVRHPETIDDEKIIKDIIKLNPDIIVVVAYGKILPKRLLKLKQIKFINIHASLLPKWRGAAPIQRAIMNQDNETGISIMKIKPKLDTGPVMMSSKITITKDMNYNMLSNQLSLLGSKMIIKSLELIEKKIEKFLPQNESEATYAKKISKSEAKISWNEQANKIVAKINALCVNPGSWFNCKGARIKPIKAIEIKAKGNPGEVLDDDFTIACSENAVQILELKKEGKQSMLAKEFLKGNNLKVGSNINNND